MIKTNYIGIDVHSSTCSFCVMNEKGAIIDNATLITNGRIIKDYLQRFKGKIKVAIEECDISLWLYQVLKGTVENVLICDPVENKNYKRAKTDKLDAKQLANLLRGGFLFPVFHNGSKEEKFRILMSGYEDNRCDLVKYKNRYKAIFRRNGIKLKDFSYTDDKQIDVIKNKDSEFVARQLFASIAECQKRREGFKSEVKRQVKKFKVSRYLISIPGIGEIYAAHIIAQIIEPRRFSSKYKLYSYCGLVRHSRMSGGKTYGSKRIWGNRTLKNVFKGAAHAAKDTNSALGKYYEQQIARGSSAKQAKNALARKIATISRSLWIKGIKYNDEVVYNNLIK